MSFGNKTITVFAYGLNVTDEDIIVAAGNTVTWNKDSSVAHFTVHFALSPFTPPPFGAHDYPDGTGALVANVDRPTDPLYVRCHKYMLTVIRPDGSSQNFDPHVIVVATGTAE